MAGCSILNITVKKVKELKNEIASLTYKPIDTTLGPDFRTGKNTHEREVLLADSIRKANEALDEVKSGIETQKTTELIALDVKRALGFLGEISGEVTSDEILGTIFSRFCIGK